jgi:hypothetical protein
LLYINEGKKASDFSIGLFQMKPSFVENLEFDVANNPKLAFHKTILIGNNSEKENRKERINRLKTLQWQLRYLKVFWSIMDYKFSHLHFANSNDKIRFYATAYNYGYNRPIQEIVRYQNIKAFPLGNNFDKNQLAFSDFSIDFINRYSSEINQ